MVIPDMIKILYKEYVIEQQENLHDSGGDLYGQIQYLPEKIFLNAASSEEQKKATLIHDFEKAAVKLKQKEANLRQYVDKDPDLHRRKDREQVVGFDKRISAEVVGKAQSHYKEWAKSIGAESGKQNPDRKSLQVIMI